MSWRERYRHIQWEHPREAAVASLCLLGVLLLCLAAILAHWFGFKL